MFTVSESEACRLLVQWALEEDLGTAGDLTSQALIPADQQGAAMLVARSEGVLAGLPAAAMVFANLSPAIGFQSDLADGARLRPGSRIARVAGSLRSILAGERTALNFLQRLSGIATLTRCYVDAVAGLSCEVLDTRKTTPGWRLLEKYAVRQGGGHNHRMGLYDGILIKDNHLAALRACKDRAEFHAVQAALNIGCSVQVEIEVDDLEQFDLALAFAELILLDNMPTGDLREAVRRRNAKAPKVLLEASGGVTLDTVRAIAETGVDRISVGALTHSAPALDIALDYVT
jgi:nicotinate-nucleotide pyrophosphorylase (carboxylating)